MAQQMMDDAAEMLTAAKLENVERIQSRSCPARDS
jgi:hypothetical protein